MRKFLCCLMSLLTLGMGMATSVSCGGKGGGDPISSSVDLTDVKLKLTKRSYTIEDGESITLQVECTVDGEAVDPSLIMFESNDTSVATVTADGVVTGVSGGTARVTVTCGSRFLNATINVVQREYTLELSEEDVLLPIGQEKQVTAKAYFGLTELTDAELSWTSSDDSIATVENGLITGVGSGKATITLSYENATANVAVAVVETVAAENVNTFSEEYINIFGRSYIHNGKLNLDHAGNGLEVGVIGTSCKMTIEATSKSYMCVFVDGAATGTKIEVHSGRKEYEIATGMEDGYHAIRVVKCTEESSAQWDIISFAADGFFAMPEKSELKIEFIGDSITAGFGNIGYSTQDYSVDNSDTSKTYAYLTAHALKADYSIVAFSGICAKAYYWISFLNMSTLYQQYSHTNPQAYDVDFDADVVVLNLGTNEASLMLENPGYSAEFSADYVAFLREVRAKRPNAYIICLYGMARKETTVHLGIMQAIREIDDGKIVYNPFDIEGNMAGASGHPSAMAHKTWAELLTDYIKSLEL